VIVALKTAPVPPEFIPATPYVVETLGATVQVAAIVPAQVPPVHTYELAVGLQLAVRVALPPGAMEAGLRVNAHTGLGGSTVIVALDGAPVPPAFFPATVKVVVAEGVTVQLTADVPAQVPPVHTYELAVGLQLAANVAELPDVIVKAGLAVR
jgi:hypothetical protein